MYDSPLTLHGPESHKFPIITACKRSLQRLCFYTYLLFCPQGTGTPTDQVHPPGPGTPPRTRYPQPGTPPGPGTSPQDQVHPPGTRYTPPPDQVHPPGPGTPSWTRYIPWDQVQHPPGAVHAGRYGQQAGGMHPTGMHSCLQDVCLNPINFGKFTGNVFLPI